jgi:hypothetical protein
MRTITGHDGSAPQRLARTLPALGSGRARPGAGASALQAGGPRFEPGTAHSTRLENTLQTGMFSRCAASAKRRTGGAGTKQMPRAANTCARRRPCLVPPAVGPAGRRQHRLPCARFEGRGPLVLEVSCGKAVRRRPLPYHGSTDALTALTGDTQRSVSRCKSQCFGSTALCARERILRAACSRGWRPPKAPGASRARARAPPPVSPNSIRR